MFTYIYIYFHTHIYIYVYTYTYIFAYVHTWYILMRISNSNNYHNDNDNNKTIYNIRTCRYIQVHMFKYMLYDTQISIEGNVFKLVDDWELFDVKATDPSSCVCKFPASLIALTLNWQRFGKLFFCKVNFGFKLPTL